MRPRAMLLCSLLAIMLMTLSACAGSKKDATPRPVASKELAAQVSAYGAAMLPQAGALEQVMDSYNPLLQNPRPGDKEWQLLVTAPGGAIDQACTALAGIEPPPELADLHAAAAGAASDCKQAKDIATAVIGSADEGGLKQAAKLGMDCVAKLATVRADLLAYAQERGIELPQVEIPDSSGSTPQPAGGSSPLPSTLNGEANLRAGPAAGYMLWATVPKGTAVNVIGRNEAGDWLVVQTEKVPQAWVATFLVDNPPDIQSLPEVRALPLGE